MEWILGYVLIGIVVTALARIYFIQEKIGIMFWLLLIAMWPILVVCAIIVTLDSKIEF